MVFEEVNFFVILGTIIGAYVYYLGTKKAKINSKINSEDLFFLIIGAFLGGILGAKIPIWILNWNTILLASGTDKLLLIIGGRTIVGAIIGGFLGVEITKRCLGIKISTGNVFAPALAIGVAIGRIGCYVLGCCYGKITDVPWAIYSFGALRHPTQIYEIIFHSIAFIIMWKKLSKEGDKMKPYTLFPAYILAYAVFRFFMEFIRGDTVPGILWLTFFQIICLAVILVISGWYIVRYLKNKRVWR
ncbi:MAG: prolipoprotein diacylglyceryl transferase [Nanoarchaeota archaeon]